MLCGYSSLRQNGMVDDERPDCSLIMGIAIIAAVSVQ